MAYKIVSIVFHGKHFYATGEYLSDGKILVHKNSQFAKTIHDSLISGGRAERLYLETNGILKNGILSQDYIFSSSSSAASAIAGHNRNGLLEFKTIEGLTLGEYLSKSLGDKMFEAKETVADKDDSIIDYYDSDVSDKPVEERIKDGVPYLPRNERARQIALAQSGNVCAIPNCKHELFVSRGGKVYLEAHHLIPISSYKDFPGINIDVPENIVCLCPSCHREIHHGNNSEKMIAELYEERKEALENRKIRIANLEQLIKYYK